MNLIKFFLFILSGFIFVSCKENSIGINPAPEQTGYKILFAGSANNDPGLFIVESNSQNLRKISDFRECYAPRWTPDGERILYLKRGGSNHELFIMDSTGSNEQKIVDGVEFFAVSPEGNKICYIYYESGWEIFVCSLDGSNKTKLTNTQRQKFGLFWSRSILKSFH
jgi:TolB protein